MLLLAIAPVIPVLAALSAVGLIGGFYWYTKREGAELDPLGPTPTPGVLPPPKPEPNGPIEPPPPPASAVVDGLTGQYDDAAFHDTSSGDSINALVTKTLNNISPGEGNRPAMIGGLRRLLNRSQWNRDLYGEPMPNDAYNFDGVAVNRVFMPKHENAIAVMRSGFMPQRNIDQNGKRVGPSTAWGRPWVPALNHNAIQNGVSDPDIMLAPPWPDGTPATEPPPELFEILVSRDAEAEVA